MLLARASRRSIIELIFIQVILLLCFGLTLAPPHDVSDKPTNDKDKDNPSKDLSTVSTLGGRKQFLNVVASGSVGSIVRSVFHLVFTLVGRFLVQLFAHFAQSHVSIVIVFDTVQAASGNKSTLFKGKSPSVGDGLERSFGLVGTGFIVKDGKLDILSGIGTSGSNVKGLVPLLGLVVFGSFDFVLAALGVLIDLEGVVLKMLRKVKGRWNICQKSVDKITPQTLGHKPVIR